MSNSDANNIYNTQWDKITKIISVISDSIKNYYKLADRPIVDDEILLISLQVFSLVCGKRWGYSLAHMTELWDLSRDIHKLSQMTDTQKSKSDLQTYSMGSLPIKYNN